MKKFRILSALLAVIMALSCLSVSTVYADETVELSITDIPDNICYADFEDMLYGITLELPDGSTVVTDEDNLDEVYYTDNLDRLGKAGVTSFLTHNDLSIFISATIYISDEIIVYARYVDYDNHKIYQTESVATYPSDFETPDVFCKDKIVYRKNNDNTLTITSYLGYEEYDENNNIIYPTIVIPESINGMTVTEIADNAFLGSLHPSEITIPESVTSIGKNALGYCYYSYYYQENHELPDNIQSSVLANELPDADDNEEFLSIIYLNNDDNASYSDYLKTTYLADCDDFEYKSDSEKIVVTATKSQILALSEEGSLLSIYLTYEYDEEYKVDEYLYSIMNEISDDELIPITININADNEKEGKEMRNNILSKYFDEDTECFYDYYGSFYVEATKSQITAMKDDEDIWEISLGDAECIRSELYRAIYFADDNDTFDICFPLLYSEDGTKAEDFYLAAHNNYFSNCEGGFFYSNFDTDFIYVVYGVTKEQIINTGYDSFIPMYLFQPSKYPDLTIYGATGSTTQAYAEANNITFAEAKSDYELGDVNLDGTISVADATLIMKANVGLEILTTQQQSLADFDGNGVVNVIDATDIQKMLAKVN